MERLTTLEQDALEELLRMQVQRARDEVVALSGAPTDCVFERFRSAAEPELAIPAWLVSQRISGDIDGFATWWISRGDGVRLMRTMTQTALGRHPLTPLEREGLTEVGHTFIDHLLDGLSTALGLRVACSVPIIKVQARGDAIPPRDFVTSVQMSHRINKKAMTTRLTLRVGGDTAKRFQRALAMYVSPFLDELSVHPAQGGGHAIQ